MASTHSVCLTAVVVTSSQHTFDSVCVEPGIRSKERLYVPADKVPFVSWKGKMDASLVAVSIVSPYLHPYRSTLSDSLHVKAQKQVDVAQYCLFNFLMTQKKNLQKTDQVANEQRNAPFPLSADKGGCHIGS